MWKQDVGTHGDCAFRISPHPTLPAVAEYDCKHSSVQEQAAKDLLFEKEHQALTAGGGAEGQLRSSDAR